LEKKLLSLPFRACPKIARNAYFVKTFDIMATEIFFIHQDIGLKFFEHVLQINDYEYTGGFDRILLSSFPIAHAT